MDHCLRKSDTCNDRLKNLSLKLKGIIPICNITHICVKTNNSKTRFYQNGVITALCYGCLCVIWQPSRPLFSYEIENPLRGQVTVCNRFRRPPVLQHLTVVWIQNSLKILSNLHIQRMWFVVTENWKNSCVQVLVH